MKRARGLRGNGQPGAGAACASKGRIMLQQGRRPKQPREDQGGSEKGRTRGGAFRSSDPPFVKPPASEPNSEIDRCDWRMTERLQRVDYLSGVDMPILGAINTKVCLHVEQIGLGEQWAAHTATSHVVRDLRGWMKMGLCASLILYPMENILLYRHNIP